MAPMLTGVLDIAAFTWLELADGDLSLQVYSAKPDSVRSSKN